MKKCSVGCPAICDFCIYYKFNRKDPDNGWCKKHKKYIVPYHSCKDFDCKMNYDIPEVTYVKRR